MQRCKSPPERHVQLAGADGLGSGVVLLDRDTDVLETAAAPAERAERRQSSEPADEEASGFPWATPEGMAAVTGGTPEASGQQKTDGDSEAMQEATAVAEDDAGGAGQQLRLPPELAQAPPGPVDPALQVCWQVFAVWVCTSQWTLRCSLAGGLASGRHSAVL